MGAEQVEFLEDNNQEVGIIVIEDELLTQSRSIMPGSGLIKAITKSKLLTIIIKNSIFTENSRSVLVAEKCTVFMHGCIISNNRFEAKPGHGDFNTTGPQEMNKFKKYNAQLRR